MTFIFVGGGAVLAPPCGFYMKVDVDAHVRSFASASYKFAVASHIIALQTMVVTPL
ncbi:hypothetical protein [Alkalihalobacillus pseudalcaliphilus]|uniref:hypothetical protein n=1 Tax=Alkalihalobacillus pseudalcaliphilus TaxID=79884 RepID=UPI000B2B8503|nr:hypothetical protein [Alkalihalobacillus pseudalcaliphilus]